jgi:DNA-binding NtrC family response regulator
MYNKPLVKLIVLGEGFHSMKRQILLLSNNQNTISWIKDTLEPLGYTIKLKQKLASGLKAVKGNELIFVDLPDTVNALKEIRSYNPDSIILTLSEKDCALHAAEEGAYDCIEKPLTQGRIKIAARNAFRFMSMKEELRHANSTEIPKFISHKNLKMHKAIKQIGRASAKNTPVLVSGEKGTGKWIVAKMLHHNGPSNTGPFVHVECTDELESRLFGSGPSLGCIVEAEGGTLYLEDIGGLEPGLRTRLASFIKERKIVSQKGEELVRVDARVVCATNGVHREDPIFKNFAVEVKLPPLRERKEDILPLAEHFLDNSAILFKTGSKALSKDARKALQKYRWPGNVGELQNIIRKACLLSKDTEVNSSHLGLDSVSSEITIKEFLASKLNRYIKGMTKLGGTGLHDTVMTEIEKSLIELVLSVTNGNQLKAAGALGINRTTLRNKISAYRIDLKRHPSK